MPKRMTYEEGTADLHRKLAIKHCERLLTLLKLTIGEARAKRSEIDAVLRMATDQITTMETMHDIGCVKHELATLEEGSAPTYEENER